MCIRYTANTLKFTQGTWHPWILVSEEVGSWNQPPLDSEGQLYCYYTYFADDKKTKASVAPGVDLPQISWLISCLAQSFCSDLFDRAGGEKVSFQ